MKSGQKRTKNKPKYNENELIKEHKNRRKGAYTNRLTNFLEFVGNIF